MPTIRIAPQLHATLRALSVAEQRPMSQIIAEAVNRYERDKFWQAMHKSFARLRADPAAWREYQVEAALWDTASGDGLECEELYPL